MQEKELQSQADLRNLDSVHLLAIMVKKNGYKISIQKNSGLHYLCLTPEENDHHVFINALWL